MATKSIKLCGPDREGNFKVLSVKNTGALFPGDVCSGDLVTNTVLKLHEFKQRPIDVTIVENRDGNLDRFSLQSETFAMESGGKVLEELRGAR